MAHPLLTTRFSSHLATSAGVVVLAAVALAGGGGCFTDPINMPPLVSINEPSAEIRRGQSVTFTARASDPNGDEPRLEWAHQALCSNGALSGPDCGTCPDSPEELAHATPPSPRTPGARYEVQALDVPFCVWVFATDSRGAVSFNTYLASPRNQNPIAQITVVSPNHEPPYDRYKEIELSGANSTDPDDDSNELHFVWGVEPTSASGQLRECERAHTAQSMCFTPDPDGTYVISLTVNDNHEGTDRGTLPIKVQPDRLPCLGLTMPMLSESLIMPGEGIAGRGFKVLSVDDDGDPFPATTANATTSLKFRWYEGPASGPLLDRGPSYVGEYDVRDFYSLGERAKVRVEIFDRNVGQVERALRSCADRDTCGTDNCLQRMTWTIQY